MTFGLYISVALTTAQRPETVRNLQFSDLYTTVGPEGVCEFHLRTYASKTGKAADIKIPTAIYSHILKFKESLVNLERESIALKARSDKPR
jgi:hypothetical protein